MLPPNHPMGSTTKVRDEWQRVVADLEPLGLAADAVEAIAVEIFKQCECSSQAVTMSMINRALELL